MIVSPNTSVPVANCSNIHCFTIFNLFTSACINLKWFWIHSQVRMVCDTLCTNNLSFRHNSFFPHEYISSSSQPYIRLCENLITHLAILIRVLTVFKSLVTTKWILFSGRFVTHPALIIFVFPHVSIWIAFDHTYYTSERIKPVYSFVSLFCPVMLIAVVFF